MSFWQKEKKEGNLIIEIEKNFSQAIFLVFKRGNYFLERTFLEKGKPEEVVPLLFKRVFQKRKSFSPQKIIFSLSQELSYFFLDRQTLFLPKNFFLGEKDLENFLQRAERNLYEKHRQAAAWRLDCSLSDLDFAFVWLDKVFIDDHLLKSPVGFRGRSLSFLLANVLSRKSLIALLKRETDLFLEKARLERPSFSPEIFFLNRESALVNLFSLLDCSKKFNPRFSKEGFVFLGVYPKKTEICYLNSFFGASQFFSLEEGFLNLFLELVKDKFSFRKEEGLKFIDLFSAGRLSTNWQKVFKEINNLAAENFLDIFLYLFRKIGYSSEEKKAIKVFIYGNGFFWTDLPLLLKKALKEKRQNKINFSFRVISQENLEKEFNFSIEPPLKEAEKKLTWFSLNAFPLTWQEKNVLSRYLWRVIRRIQ